MAVVQVFMLYGLDIWVITMHIGRVLGGFHHRMACRLMGRQPQRGWESGWLYPLLEEAMAEAGLQEVEAYISHHQNTVTHFINTRPIMDLCLASARSPGSRVANRWWEQDVFDLEGMWMAAWEAEKT